MYSISPWRNAGNINLIVYNLAGITSENGTWVFTQYVRIYITALNKYSQS